jgi:hypothetical protein
METEQVLLITAEFEALLAEKDSTIATLEIRIEALLDALGRQAFALKALKGFISQRVEQE